VLLTEVTYLKDAGETQFAIVDAAMNDLIRPALYNARHPARPVHAPRDKTERLCRVVGPVCESSDDFGCFENLGDLRAGDILAFDHAGAYAASMSSTYNSRALLPEVIVDGDRFRVIRRRFETTEALALETPGPWSKGTTAI
jgi:diaminopimelate decarboxylase